MVLGHSFLQRDEVSKTQLPTFLGPQGFQVLGMGISLSFPEEEEPKFRQFAVAYKVLIHPKPEFCQT